MLATTKRAHLNSVGARGPPFRSIPNRSIRSDSMIHGRIPTSTRPPSPPVMIKTQFVSFGLCPRVTHTVPRRYTNPTSYHSLYDSRGFWTRSPHATSTTTFFTRILARALYGALISGIETGATRVSESSDVVLKSERLSIASRIVGYRISEDEKELGSYTPRTFNRATPSEAG